MYASQTKRLCVRGAATSDESSRVQHHSASSSEAALSATTASTSSLTPVVPYQQQQSTSPSSATSPQQSNSYNPHQFPLERFDSVASATVLSSTLPRTTAVAASAAAPSAPKMTASATDAPKDNKSTPKNSPQVSLLNNQPTTTASTTITTPPTTTTTTASTRQAHGTLNNQDNDPNDPNSSAVQDLINRLSTAAIEDTQLDTILSLRNLITACNRRKETLTTSPNFSKIVELLDDDNISLTVKSQLALLICSIAKGGEHTVKELNEYHVDEKILQLTINATNEALVEAGLRCLRSIMSWSRVSRTWILYENLTRRPQTRSETSNNTSSANGQVVANLEKLISYCYETSSPYIQECVADLFALTCTQRKDQVLLFKASPMPCILRLLDSPSCRVVIAALNWLNQLCLKNHLISAEVVKAVCINETPLLNKLARMTNQDQCLELQFLAAQCFVHIYKALATDELTDDPRVHNSVLPTLVRMVHKDKPPHLRAKAAECITYLIEHDTRLQNTASICDRLIESLASMLSYEPNKTPDDNPSVHQAPSILERGTSWRTITCCSYPYVTDTQATSHLDLIKFSSSDDIQAELCLEMRRAAFLALASLGSNLEPIRKKIFNTCAVMQHLVKNLNEGDTRTLLAVLSCLLSLSRSVQQLRTSFAESSVYSALKNLLSTSSNDVLVLVLAVLCNISLDFSPGKQHFLDSKTVETLCNLTRSQDPFLRLHGMWILMNMVYQLDNLGLKTIILNTLGLNHVLELLETEDNDELVMKTLGFLRNLISQRSHIDAIMNNHGDKIMKALIRLLEKKCALRLKEQAVCVLTNIADGVESKSLIMNRNVLNYLARTICDEQAGDLRLAAICCITNLIYKEQDGSYERRDEMKKFGIEEKLKSLLETKDPILSDRVRTAYNQFLLGMED